MIWSSKHLRVFWLCLCPCCSPCFHFEVSQKGRVKTSAPTSVSEFMPQSFFPQKHVRSWDAHRCHRSDSSEWKSMLNHFASWIQTVGTTKKPPEWCCFWYSCQFFLRRKAIQDKTHEFFFLHLLLGQWLVAGAWALGVIQNVFVIIGNYPWTPKPWKMKV